MVLVADITPARTDHAYGSPLRRRSHTSLTCTGNLPLHNAEKRWRM